MTDLCGTHIFEKAVKLVEKWGGEITTLRTINGDDTTDPNIYIANADGRALKLFIRPKDVCGMQFIDCEVFKLDGTEYQQSDFSSPSAFLSIKSL